MINLSPLHTQTYNIGKVSGEKRKKKGYAKILIPYHMGQHSPSLTIWS